MAPLNGTPQRRLFVMHDESQAVELCRDYAEHTFAMVCQIVDMYVSIAATFLNEDALQITTPFSNS